MYNIKYKFEAITNETEAYIIGYLLSDGYIMDGPFYRVGISLAIRDEEILKKIKDYISDDCPIKYDRNNCTFLICRKEIVDNIKKLGFETNKTKKEIKIPQMPSELIRHFIRGYFDGDGGLVKDRDYLYMFICSPTKEILDAIEVILKNNNIGCKITIQYRKGKEGRTPTGTTIFTMDQYRLYIKNRTDLERFFNYLYRDISIKQLRKYTKFKDWLDNKEVYRITKSSHQKQRNMNSSQVWKLVDNIGWGVKTTDYESVRSELSEKYTKEEIEKADVFLHKKSLALYKKLSENWLSNKLNSTGLSDDGFHDFCCEIVGRGKDFYEKIMEEKNVEKDFTYTENFMYCFLPKDENDNEEVILQNQVNIS